MLKDFCCWEREILFANYVRKLCAEGGASHTIEVQSGAILRIICRRTRIEVNGREDRFNAYKARLLTTCRNYYE